MEKSLVFIDSEVGFDGIIHDIGAIKADHTVYHSASVHDFFDFISGADYLCGHNIARHDLPYLTGAADRPIPCKAIDTLYLSPLLFPKKPYHALLKDDKLQTEEWNNPVNDCRKAEELFYDEVDAFHALPDGQKEIYYCLLNEFAEFSGFFAYLDYQPDPIDLPARIREAFQGKLCANAEIDSMVGNTPMELAYALALISAEDAESVTPPWLLKNFPKIENVMKLLRNTPCADGCDYCRSTLDIHRGLKQIFGFDGFRTYNGEPLQEQAAQAAMDGKSLLAVFPTGGGKSITFQLPALMAGMAAHGLTVVISPLQSLMKDQVDNLSEAGIVGAVTINGLLSPVERADACERVLNGSASLLYISPEQLRSRTIEKMLLSRNVVRFVIDEAHCFSAWGQDFRVDYLYIGDFIRELQRQKANGAPIPVSCFTATAKQKVISDIQDYFRRKLDLELSLFASSATRENLHYTVLFKETDEEKYNALRDLISQRDCPTIVYVSRTKRTYELAGKLTSDGFPARPFNGKMESTEKVANQEAFLRNEVSVMVATSAFGMGVDKKDVGLVIHYDISDSLENYVQEAGRAGRDPSMQAECYVLYNNNDLDKHFILLNQTKLSIGEIQQVWKAIKDLTRSRPNICCSPLEIARQAGWDDSGPEMETRVKTAVASLETAGYVKRGRNVPHIYASSIRVKDMNDAAFRIDRSPLFTEPQRLTAKRIIKSLISKRSIAVAGNDDAESRIDYLADILGLSRSEVVESVNLMRQEGLLADAQDMSAYILKSDRQNKSLQILDKFAKLERFLLTQIAAGDRYIDLKKMNEAALAAGISSASVRSIRTILYFLTIKGYIQKVENKGTGSVETSLLMEEALTMAKYSRRIALCRFILAELFEKAAQLPDDDREETPVTFSLVGLFKSYQAQPRMELESCQTSLEDVEDSLLYLSKIDALKLEGGFLVLYNGMEIHRLVTDNRIKYKLEDYRQLNEFYRQKIQQIHIVGRVLN